MAPPFLHTVYPLPFILLAVFCVQSSSASIPVLRRQELETGFQVDLRHIDAGRNFSKLQLIQRGLTRGKQRLQRMAAMAATAGHKDVQVPVQVGNGEYAASLMIGTPAVPVTAIVDTGSDLIWTQCSPCISCYPQSTPIFNPKNSSTFSHVSCSSMLCKAVRPTKCDKSCDYAYTYGDGSLTEGSMAKETFTFGKSEKRVSVPHLGFGCGLNNLVRGMHEVAGLLGLGRGVLSLVSQLGMKKFSYCLTSLYEQNKTSRLLFGSLADANFTHGKIARTPLIQNPHFPSYYYLSLEGITVGGNLLPIPKSIFQLGKDGSGGMIIDSGTTITYLQQDAYDAMKKAFISLTKLRVSKSSYPGLDLCFDLPKNVSDVDVPNLVFHFKGLDLELPVVNYMLPDKEQGLICLAIDPTDSISIFGNIQQQNMLVFHDLESETLSFVPTHCDKM